MTVKHLPRVAFLFDLFLFAAPAAAAPSDLDPAFLDAVGAGLTGSCYPASFPSGAVQALGIQPDGEILVGNGGGMSRFNNSGELTALKRLNADGTFGAGR
jgi:hypothetical protein